MDVVSRRTFGKQTLGALLTYSLLESLGGNDLFADSVKPITSKWLADVNAMAEDVKNQTLRHVEWQRKTEELFSKVDLPELLRFVDFERLNKNAKLIDKGAKSFRCRFPKVEGLPTSFVFGRQIFGMKKGCSVVPHGHNNMATAFLVLDGTFRGRHYDRLEDEPEHLIIRPTIDREFQVGSYSTVSDYQDNVHWFQAVSDRAFLFNIHVFHVHPGSVLPTSRVYVNPQGEPLADGLIRAPRIDYEEAVRLFGKTAEGKS